MQNMFGGLSSLDTLTLGEAFTFKTNAGLSKYWYREGDDTIYAAADLMANYDGSTMAGTYRGVVKLTISETVKGNIADINKNFNFTINVQDNEVGINTTHTYTGSKTGTLVFNNGNATFTLKHNESIYIYLPYGASYTITQDSDGYTLSKSNDTGILSSDKTANFIDTLNGTTPSGIFLDLIPFIILIIIGVFGIVLIKRLKYI